MIPSQTIEEVKKRLVRAYDPISIYLFGSYVWGCPDDESDLDILVVLDSLTKKPWEDIVIGHKVLADLGIAKDILIIDKARFDEYSEEPPPFYF